MSASCALAASVLAFVGVDVEVVEVVAPDVAAAARPEGQDVAGGERLADHRDVGAGHEVERRPPVGRREPHEVLEALVDRHRRPPVRPHRQREVVVDRGPGVLAAAVGDLHPVAVDAADRPVADRRRGRRRAAGPATARGSGASPSTPKTSAMVAWRSTFVVSASMTSGLRAAVGPGQWIMRGVWPSGSNWGTIGLPQMSARESSPGAPVGVRRRGSGRGRCTRSRRCCPTGPAASSSSRSRPNQWSIIDSLAP